MCAMALTMTAALTAESWTRYEGQPGSKVRIDGTSTIHEWFVESKLIGGYMEWESSFPLDPSVEKPPALKVKPKVEVKIPVNSLKSGKPAMDSVMHAAMKKEEHPVIKYKLSEMTLKEGPRRAGDPLRFDTKGELTVSGVTKTQAMEVVVERIEQNQLKVTGTAAVKMTDFGIKPPAPKIALGLISTGDDVKITFEWKTAVKGETK